MTHNITSLKSPKSALVKKALIIGAAATGLIIAGALAFAAVSSNDEDAPTDTE